MRLKRVASMKDVARLAGVSISTLSRVINRTVPVDARTRAKVERAIGRLQFKPNLLASELRSKSGRVIGLVVPEILHPTFNAIINYVEESIRSQSLQLILGNTRNDAAVEADFIESLIRRHVDGIIFSRVSDQSRIIQVAHRSREPVVVLDRALDSEDIPTVVLNNYRADVLSAEHLAGLGHRRIGCITGRRNILLCRERLSGIRETLRARGIILEANRVREGDFTYETGFEGVRALFADGDLPTAT